MGNLFRGRVGAVLLGTDSNKVDLLRDAPGVECKRERIREELCKRLQVICDSNKDVVYVLCQGCNPASKTYEARGAKKVRLDA